MQLSLLKARKCLAPLAWLLAFAMLAPAASPHIVRGLVLCIGSGHVDIEEAGAGHHDKRPGPAAPAEDLLAGAAPTLFAYRDAKLSEEDGPCKDIPLRLTRGAADPCHQAVQSKVADVEVPSLDLFATTALERESRAGTSHSLPRSAVPSAPSPRPSSTVVLLI